MYVKNNVTNKGLIIYTDMMKQINTVVLSNVAFQNYVCLETLKKEHLIRSYITEQFIKQKKGFRKFVSNIA